jgi:predicted Zn-dependent protease
LVTVGLDGLDVRMREIATDAASGEAGFVGSPTILIDGVDVVPPTDEPTGLTCRVYVRRDGRYAPTPDPNDLRDALQAALAAGGD